MIDQPGSGSPPAAPPTPPGRGTPPTTPGEAEPSERPQRRVRIRAPLGLPMALTLAAYLAVGQAELLLRQFQQTDTQAFGVSALGGGLVPRPETARVAVRLWSGPPGPDGTPGTEDQATWFLIGYTAIDLLLIAALAWLALAVMARLTLARRARGDLPDEGIYYWYAEPWVATRGTWWRRCRPLLAFVVADIAEDVFRLLAWWWDGNVVFVVASWAMEKVKWLAIILLLLTIATGWWDVHKRESNERTAKARRRLGYVSTVRLKPQSYASYGRGRRAAKVLRGQIGIVVVLGLLLLVDATGQVGDIVRRWVDAPLSGLVGLAAVVLLSLVLWSSSRRIILSDTSMARYAKTPQETSRALWIGWLGSIVVAVVLWLAFGSWIPLALPAVGALLIVLELIRKATGWGTFQQRYDEAQESTVRSTGLPSDAWRGTLQTFGRIIAAFPVVLVGVVMVKAGAGPLVLAVAPGEYDIVTGLVLCVGGVTLIWLGCTALPSRLAVADEADPQPQRRERRHLLLAAIALLAAVVLVAWPLDVPPVAGSLAVVGIGFSVIGLGLAELQRLSEVSVPPQGLAMLGFHRIPVLTLLAVWFVLASVLDFHGDHYEIRTTDTRPVEAAVNDVWEDWLAANCVSQSDGPVPLVLTTAYGGGIRAAYWTASVLTDLERDVPAVEGCETASLSSRAFALTGISGGSVGAAAFYSQPSTPTEDWFESDLGEPDYAAVALAGGLLVDLPHSLVGFPAPDRAARLEQAWEKHMEGMAGDYFRTMAPGLHDDGRWMPITLFNGAQVETGCRVNTSAIALTASPASTRDCRANAGRRPTRTLEDRSIARHGVRVPAAAVTVDTVTIADAAGCRKSFRVSTAGLLSARWPYISPSGKLPCSEIRVVDGGYADGAGNAALLDLWHQLEPLVAAHNESVRGVRGQPDDAGMVVPVLVVVDNHYQSSAAAPAAGRTAELLVPPLTYVRASGTRSADRDQEVLSAVSANVPGQPEWVCTFEGATRGRYLLAPSTRPGLPAPLAWTLAGSSRADLDNQRDELFADDGEGTALQALLTGDGSELGCTVPR